MSTSATQETRTCRGCFVKGHLYRNCPDNPNRAPAEDTKIMIAAGEDDAADEDVYDSTAFMITDTTKTARDNDSCSMVLFSPTEVLLDNQAGRSIFKNRSLLSNVSNVTPFYIGGIDGASRGLRIDQEGDFEDLDRVACETTAAANILSKARLLDAGNTVSYDQSNDVYQLQGQQRRYTFARKMLQDGRRSSHYACDMADTDQTFVITVKDKYLASGAFERFKARLIAGGNQQDKGLYEDLSSPTVATSSVLAIAAIAAAERRKVIAIGIGVAFLNADMAPTRVEVHMRLN
jgi:hypothetical protein